MSMNDSDYEDMISSLSFTEKLITFIIFVILAAAYYFLIKFVISVW